MLPPGKTAKIAGFCNFRGSSAGALRLKIKIEAHPTPVPAKRNFHEVSRYIHR
jgi:hypothetical protein